MTVREKKTLISSILQRVQSVNDHELKDSFQKNELPSSVPAPPQMPLPEIPHPWLPPDNGPPPLPTSSLPEGYYEEAVPLSPGKAPEYITSHYDSDAMSSSYESYDEEEEDGKGKKMRHQWPSEEASMDLVKDAKICAFLLRKKRFGQWTKLLCVIKENKLLCYKSSKDQQPQMELTLSGCNISYIPKDSKKKKHELKITHQGADALVLAVQSKEQADEWLKVIKDVCSSCNGSVDSDGATSGSPVHKTELEKKLSSERPSSDGEGPFENGLVVSDGKEHVKSKKNSKTEPKATVTKVTGKKITKIIGLGKKKPSTDEQTSSAEEDIPTCGYLLVLSNNRWRERWCRVRDNKLFLHKDRTDLKTHMASIPLRGCEVIPGLDSKHQLAFRLLRNGQEVAVLEAFSSEEMGRWIGVLLAETGSSRDPGALHYDYIDVEMTANVVQSAKHSFCLMSRRAVSPCAYLDNPVNGYAYPSGLALHYDDVPCGTSSEPEDVFPSSGSRRCQEETFYENADLYDNLPPTKFFLRFSPTHKTNRLSTSKLSSNYCKSPVSSTLSSAQSVTNTSIVGRGSVGLPMQV
nr:PREDICTED: actin filament-associated protein 1 isoform X2 [Latimeria chalumnae]|eukprot:XP_014344486.1 PREDICTED: actin filament-associated protein 1 isoform X2 [Latimeria chalumnae]